MWPVPAESLSLHCTMYAAMIPTVISRQSEFHTQLFRQLGVALMICMVTSTQCIILNMAVYRVLVLV